MTTFYNITEARSKLPAIANKTHSWWNVVLTKNGKPILTIVNYDSFEQYNKWLEKKKKDSIRKSISKLWEESKKLGLWKKYLEKKWLKEEDLSEEDLYEIIAKEK